VTPRGQDKYIFAPTELLWVVKLKDAICPDATVEALPLMDNEPVVGAGVAAVMLNRPLICSEADGEGIPSLII
jgi:hypothetical protein